MDKTNDLPTYDVLIADISRLIEKMDYHDLRVTWQAMRAMVGEIK